MAGEAALFLFLLQNALRARSAMVRMGVGVPGGVIPGMLEHFYLFAIFSAIGWLLVGLPVAVFFPARLLARLSWPARLLAGAALGPIALFAIFVLLSRGISLVRAVSGIQAIFGFSQCRSRQLPLRCT